mgnify:CR=1 FL=1
MKIMYMVLGPFMTNTYILYNEETMEGLVVDPSFTPDHYIKAIQDKKPSVHFPYPCSCGSYGRHE